MWKKYWKFNDWVFEKVTGEKFDSTQEWKEVPERWRRFKKEPFKYIVFQKVLIWQFGASYG